MDPRPEIGDDEISLYDIYEFLRDGWKTLVGMSVLGVVAGLVLSFVLPVKFEASGSIEPARVAGEPVEEVDQLAEKMRSPTYYDRQTLEVCELLDKLNPAAQLAKDLSPSVGRQSAFVAVKFQSSSPDLAKQCLQAVIEDVKRNQEELARSSRESVRDQIRVATQQLERATQLRDQELALNAERLTVAKDKLATAQRFINEFEKRALNFDFKNDQFSASSLLVTTLQSKQNEAKDLQIQIDSLQMKVQAKITSVDVDVFESEEKLVELRESLEPPATRDAQFATPIYASDTKVSPKRALITVIALFLGGFVGLMLLIARRAYRGIKAREVQTQ